MKILPNNVAIIETDAWISQWVTETGRLDHDQNLLPVILPYINKGDFVIDVGAFIGDHTIAYLDRVGDEGTVLAFEPNPEPFRCLRYNCKKSINFNVGLSDRNEFMDIKIDRNCGASYLIPSIGGIPVMQLDTLSIPKLNFLKIDAEGMEQKILRGASYTIATHKPVILLEINEGALQRNGTSGHVLITFLEENGYYKKKVYESDTLDGPQFDLLFIPR